VAYKSFSITVLANPATTCGGAGGSIVIDGEDDWLELRDADLDGRRVRDDDRVEDRVIVRVRDVVLDPVRDAAGDLVSDVPTEDVGELLSVGRANNIPDFELVRDTVGEPEAVGLLEWDASGSPCTSTVAVSAFASTASSCTLTLAAGSWNTSPGACSRATNNVLLKLPVPLLR
jgi:hypothetical protein